jgi:methionyl-tRNA formyltransferase
MINSINGRIKLFDSEIINNYESNYYSNHIQLLISDKQIIITQDSIALKIGSVQWPGKRRMDTFEFVKGFRERGVFKIISKKKT